MVNDVYTGIAAELENSFDNPVVYFDSLPQGFKAPHIKYSFLEHISWCGHPFQHHLCTSYTNYTENTSTSKCCDEGGLDGFLCILIFVSAAKSGNQYIRTNRDTNKEIYQ